MNFFGFSPGRSLWAALLVLSGMGALAFPPALHHVIYGTLLDEWGALPSDPDIQIIFETPAGVRISTTIVQGREPGVNYTIKIPMDAGLTADAYQPTALRPQVPFKVRVRLGRSDYYPIQMQATYAKLGRPGQKTRLDLTLGEDTDGDGLPDAWEHAIDPDISKVKPDGDSDADGMSNRDEYLAGTYAFDGGHTFDLKISGLLDGAPLLSFTSIRGRSYSVEGSTDLKDWQPVSFLVPGQDAEPRQTFSASDVQVVTVAVSGVPAPPAPTFFRLVVR